MGRARVGWVERSETHRFLLREWRVSLCSTHPAAPGKLNESTFADRFSPRTVATYNSNDIMVAKLEGPFHWHKHDDTDDLFLVLTGTLDIELRDRTVTLKSGDLFVVPKGVEHRPVAHGEVHILLIEPTGTPNTGDKATAAPRILA